MALTVQDTHVYSYNGYLVRNYGLLIGVSSNDLERL